MKRTRKAPSLASLGVEDDNDLLRRAFAAWFKDRRNGASPDQPSNLSAVEAHAGHWYAVLRGGRGSGDAPMAVYRLKNDGILRRLRRWPASIEG